MALPVGPDRSDAPDLRQLRALDVPSPRTSEQAPDLGTTGEETVHERSPDDWIDTGPDGGGARRLDAP